MAIKGQNLRLFLKGANDAAAVCIASATSCQIHLGTETADTSTKDSDGGWNESEVVGKSWDASCDALVLLTDPVSGGSAKTAVDIISLIGQEVTLTFDLTSGANNRTASSPAATIKKSGKAIVSDISISAANKQNSTYTVQFTGNGALA